jgi:predicted dehydrogenase
MGKLRIGIIGAGYWGPNLVRNFALVPNAEVAAIADLQEARRKFIKDRYPTINALADDTQLIGDESIDAVVIATPVNTHYRLAEAALKAGKHVMLEKPMCASAAECDQLIELATKSHLTLMVDHTFLYTGAVRYIRQAIAEGKIGDILYFDSVRVNLGLFQHDVNVIWDLAPHDVSIMDAIMPQRARAVAAVGRASLGTKVENIAYMTVTFEDTSIAHFHLNWLAPVKVRTTLIGGTKQMIVYDDTENSEKIKVYDKGVTVAANVEEIHRKLVEYRIGDMFAPRLDSTEALFLAAKEFTDAIREKRKPLTDAESGRRVVSILEAASESLKRDGAPVGLAGQ